MRNVLLVGVTVCAVVLMGTRAKADTAYDIETGYAVSNNVVFDGDNGLDPVTTPIITCIASQPGFFGGHTFTGWSILAQDATGSLDLFAGKTFWNYITTNAYSNPQVGDRITADMQWNPYHQIPEIVAFTNAYPHGNNYAPNYVYLQSTGNAVPAAPVFTISQINLPVIPQNVAGYLIRLDGVTFSGSTGSFQSVFPNYAQANITSESYTITDGSGSMTMFDWVTSYSTAAALAGTAVPAPGQGVTVYGFMSYNTGGPAEFTVVSVPEPSTVMLVGAGLFGLLALRRRRS